MQETPLRIIRLSTTGDAGFDVELSRLNDVHDSGDEHAEFLHARSEDEQYKHGHRQMAPARSPRHEARLISERGARLKLSAPSGVIRMISSTLKPATLTG